MRKVSQQKLLSKLEELRKSLIGLPRGTGFPRSELTESLRIASGEELVRYPGDCRPPDSHDFTIILTLVSWPLILACVSISWGMKVQETGIWGPHSINGDPHKRIPQSWSSWSSLIKIPISIG